MQTISDVVQAICSIILAIITGFYVYQTKKLVDESVKATSAARETADKQAELVAATIRPVLGLKKSHALAFNNALGYPVHLCFTNHGQGAAWFSKLKIVTACILLKPI